MAEPLTSQVWVAAWLQKADHDLETAERALYAGSPITDTAAYHCHQAAEKALKAFLASRFKPLVKTHDLIDLLTRCADSDVRFATCAANGPTLSRIREFDHLQPKAYAMKIRHFEDTDTLLIELKLGSVAEIRDLDENTVLDCDAQGQVLAITLEHATSRAELSSFSFDRVAA